MPSELQIRKFGTQERHASVVDERRPSRGFTLVELLVVLTIIALLLALVIPGVQSARESARRMQCSNNIRLLTHAITTHLNTFGTFPDGGSGWWDARTWIEPPTASSPGAPQLAPRQNWGWAYQILPYMDQMAVWSNPSDAGVANNVISAHYCPSRRAPGCVLNTSPNGPSWSWGPRGMLDYAGNSGPNCSSMTSWANYGDAPTSPIVRNTKGVVVTPAHIRDGFSNTMLLGEKWLNTAFAGRVNMGDDDNGFASGWDADNMRWACFQPERDVYDLSMVLHNAGGLPYTTQRASFGSSHHGSFTITLCDGSVRPLEYNVDFSLFQNLCHRSDGKAISLP